MINVDVESMMPCEYPETLPHGPSSPGVKTRFLLERFKEAGILNIFVPQKCKNIVMLRKKCTFAVKGVSHLTVNHGTKYCGITVKGELLPVFDYFFEY